MPSKPTNEATPAVALETLAEEIKTISEGVSKLLKGPLKRRSLILLICDAAPGAVNRKQVDAVLEGIQNLGTVHLK